MARSGQQMSVAAPGMPLPQQVWVAHHQNPLIAQHQMYNHEELGHLPADALPLLNLEQRAAYNGIMAAYTTRQGGMFFIHGPGVRDPPEADSIT